MEMNHLQEENSQLRRELDNAVMQGEPGTTTRWRLETLQLEEKLRDALREGKDAKRCLRAYKNNITQKEHRVKVKALERELAEEKVENRATVDRLEKIFRNQKEKLRGEISEREKAQMLLCKSLSSGHVWSGWTERIYDQEQGLVLET
jgi:hypothetical protein